MTNIEYHKQQQARFEAKKRGQRFETISGTETIRRNFKPNATDGIGAFIAALTVILFALILGAC
jgi:hypothetical protein